MIDPEILKNMVPLTTLTDENLERLAKKLELEEHAQGEIIINESDTDNDAIYLIEGGVELKSTSTTLARVIHGGTEEAAYALAQTRPRQFTISATTPIKILRIDNNRLDRVVILDELTTTITSIQEGNDKPAAPEDTTWMREMMNSELFEGVPNENLGPLALNLLPLSVKTGEVVFRQGDEGDYYYVVREGRFNVSRKGDDGKVRMVAELHDGSVFGEESLITGETRSTSIIAMSDGVLMRLPKSEFKSLLELPLIQPLGKDAAERMVKQGAKLCDVRTPTEFKARSLRGSVNLPVITLRNKLSDLDSNAVYIVFCDTGVRSRVAAFLMSQYGLTTHVLEGGLKKLSVS